MDIQTKYKQYREVARDGDILLAYSDKFVARAIRSLDKSYYHHSGIVTWQHGRLTILGAHPEGANPDFLSRRIRKKKWSDFAIIRPLFSEKDIKEALKDVFEVAQQYNNYDFALIGRVLMYSWFGIDLKFLGSENNICSELTQFYGVSCGEHSWVNDNLERPFFLPHDHIRLITSNWKPMFLDYNNF